MTAPDLHALALKTAQEWSGNVDGPPSLVHAIKSALAKLQEQHEAEHKAPRHLITKKPIQCRLCEDPATMIVHVPSGCVCATDPVQALCNQHWQTLEPLDDAVVIFTLTTESNVEAERTAIRALAPRSDLVCVPRRLLELEGPPITITGAARDELRLKLLAAAEGKDKP